MPRYRENSLNLLDLLLSKKLKKPPGGDSHIKGTRLPVGNLVPMAFSLARRQFWKEPQREVPRSCFVGVVKMFLAPKKFQLIF